MKVSDIDPVIKEYRVIHNGLQIGRKGLDKKYYKPEYKDGKPVVLRVWADREYNAAPPWFEMEVICIGVLNSGRLYIEV